MIKEIMRYPAIFYPDEGDIGVYFPDLDAVTCGDNLEDAYEMAKEVLGVWIEENMNKDVAPQPTAMDEALKKLSAGVYDDEVTQHRDDSVILLVEADAALIKKLHKKAVKVNTSIPAWMKTAADNQGINISKVLQEALVREFDKTAYNSRSSL